jgi:hypothetical protein
MKAAGAGSHAPVGLLFAFRENSCMFVKEISYVFLRFLRSKSYPAIKAIMSLWVTGRLE